MSDRTQPGNLQRPPSRGRAARALLILLGAALVVVAAGWWLLGRDTSESPVAELDAEHLAGSLPLDARAIVAAEAANVDETGDPVLAPVEPLVGEDEDVSVRGSRRELARWGHGPGAGGRAPCTVVVIDWNDRPVPGAVAHVWGDESAPKGGHVRKLAPAIGPFDSTTDAEGRCTVSPPLHRPRVRVEKAGVGESDWVQLAPRDGSDQYRELLVPLRPPATLVGRVVQPDGTPAPGAVVRLGTFGPDPVVSAEPIAVSGDGRFELAVPSLEPLGLKVHLPDSDTRWHRFTLQPGETREVLLRLPGAFAIRGSFADSAGRPFVPDSTLWVKFWPDAELIDDAEGFEGRGNDLRVEADEAGRFEFILDRPARGVLTAWGDVPGLSEPPVVAIDATHPQADAVLRIAEAASISGRLLDEDGAPLAGLKVSAVADPIPRLAYGPLGRPEGFHLHGGSEAVTTEGGEFVLSGLHPRGVYTVSARDEQRDCLLSLRGIQAGTSEVVLAAGSAAEKSAEIVLVVMAGDTGGRASSVGVKAFERAAGGGWLDSQSVRSQDTSGLVTVGWLRPDTGYDLLVSSEGLGCAFMENIVTKADGEALKLQLPALATLTIDVTAGGRAAPWPVVSAERDVSAQELRQHRQHVTRRARGLESERVELLDLEPGQYSLVVTQGGRRAIEPIELAPGEARSLQIDID